MSTIVTALVVMAAVWVVLTPHPPTESAIEPDARPAPTASPTPAPVTGPIAVVAAGTPKPEACDKIYSPGMAAAFGDLVLNPAWTTDPGTDVREGSDDPQLLAVINNAEHLSCHWVSPVGPSGSGVVTNLVWLTEEQTQAVANRLRELALNCYEELGGLRCITETRGDEGVSGQSHFLRGGIWLATQFINAGPDGYTHDMVATLWNGA
ncbi:hypothetical protein [Cryobacterium sp. AP23]